MANDIQNLYFKYRNRVERSLESDKYYDYLFTLLMESPHTIRQQNRILHKVVDERWLTAVEDALDAIDRIISRPRRFIKAVENVVPIELAKKISGDSVRHLSQNTQFINNMDKKGQIRPNRILNVENEESYDLYENRFLATLITKLVRFIDKRTDILFWSTGDERESVLDLNSNIEDEYESIEYCVSMRIKNKQSYMENDAAQMETFKRIDRVRRIVMEFKKSNFMALMADTAPVRPPIQRTNLLMKDPYYKKCYTLWQFLERYDEVGYSIDVKESALDFDEEYLFHLYSNIIMNYTVFKTLLDGDPRRIEDAPAKRKKVVKPKFIKQIVEEFVDDYNIPDVEIRKIVIQEITKAQAEIEKKRLQKEKKDAQREKTLLAAEKKKQRVAKQKELEKQKQKLAKEKENAKRLAALKAAKEKEKARLAKLKEREKLLEKQRIAKQKEKQRQQKLKQRQLDMEKARKLREKTRLAQLKKKQLEKQRAQKQKKTKKPVENTNR